MMTKIELEGTLLIHPKKNLRENNYEQKFKEERKNKGKIKLQKLRAQKQKLGKLGSIALHESKFQKNSLFKKRTTPIDNNKLEEECQVEEKASRSKTLEDIVSNRRAENVMDVIASYRNGCLTERTERPKTTALAPSYITYADLPKRKPGAEPELNAQDDRDKHHIAIVDTLSKTKKNRKDIIDWMEKQSQLSHRIAILERENAKFLCSNRVSIKYLAYSLSKELDELEEERLIDTRLLNRGLGEMRKKITSVKNEIVKIRQSDSRDEESIINLQNLIQEAEKKLSSYRTSQREAYRTLVSKERSIQNELSNFSNRMDTWKNDLVLEKTVLSNSPAKESAWKYLKAASRIMSVFDTKQNIANARPQGKSTKLSMRLHIQKLNETLVKNGGTSGDWHSSEHSIFLKLLTKLGISNDLILSVLTPNLLENYIDLSDEQLSQKDDDNLVDNNLKRKYEARVSNFVARCLTKFPQRSSKSIRSHLIWYAYYLRVLEEKKKIIQEWKDTKENEKKKSLLVVSKEYEIESNNEELRLAKEKAEKIKKKKKTIEIEKWKKVKEDAEVRNREKELEECSKLKAMEAAEKQKRIEIKQQIALYNLQKEENQDKEVHLHRLAEIKKKPPSQKQLIEASTKGIDRAKEQFEAIKKKSEVEETKHRSNKVVSKKSSDPTRILRDTTVMKQRKISKEELMRKNEARRGTGAHDSYVPGGQSAKLVKEKSYGHIPIQPRAMPSWRKNL